MKKLGFDGTVTARDHLKEELGTLAPETHAKLVLILQGFMAKVRALPHEIPAESIGENPIMPACCGTCAFEPSTDNWPGFPSTAFGLLRALHTPMPFLCHQGQPEWRERTVNLDTAKYCHAFMVAFSFNRKEVRQITHDTFTQIFELIPTAPHRKKFESETPSS